MGEKYDTISNIGSIGGRENLALVKSWKIVLKQIEQTLVIINEIKDLELAKSVR